MATVSMAINVQIGPKQQEGRRDYEARFAKRAMMLVRRLLGIEGMKDLLRDEITSANEYWKTKSEESHGKWKSARIKLSLRGIACEEFLRWFVPEGGDPDAERVASHPEHWFVYVKKDSHRLSVLETLGDKVSLFDLVLRGSEPAHFVEEDSSSPKKMIGSGYTEDGTYMLEAYHQFKDHSDGQGFDSDLAVYFPAAVEEEVVETHRQHLLVEFCNWFESAYKDLRTKESGY